MTRRSYPAGTVEALIALSHCTCYSPGCARPVIVMVAKQPRLDLEIAHIEALHEGGPRYRADMTDRERNSFQNLILLCRPHHRHVDDEHQNVGTAELQRWKREAEIGIPSDEVEVFRGLTADKLEEVISDVIEQHALDVRSALDEIKELNYGHRDMLRLALSRMDDAELAGGYVDADKVSMLNDASMNLRHTLTEDNVATLYAASRLLRPGLNQDVVGMLGLAAKDLKKLGGLQETAVALHNLTKDPVFKRLPDTVASLQQTVRRIPREY